MGRVLMSMNQIPHDKPEHSKESLQGFKDPENCKYKLDMYFYELEWYEKNQDYIKIKIKWGDNSKIESSIIKYKKINFVEKNNNKGEKNIRNYVWKGKDVYNEKSNVELTMPLDRKQCPDIIISVYSVPNGVDVGKRIGYARIEAENKEILDGNSPEWITFKNPWNNYLDSVKGSLLCNLCLTKVNENETNQLPKLFAKRDAQKPHTLYINVWGCIGLLPDSPSDDIKASVEITFGNQCFNWETDKATRNPIFYDYENELRMRDSQANLINEDAQNSHQYFSR